MRLLGGSGGLLFACPEAVPHADNGMDQGVAEVPIDFLAQGRDVDNTELYVADSNLELIEERLLFKDVIKLLVLRRR